MSYIYLASPYTHEFKCIQEERFTLVCKCAAYYMKRNYHIFSPIAHTHPIATVGSLPTHFDYWNEYDRIMLSQAKEMWILTIPGWKKSTGVQKEIEIAKELEKDILYTYPYGKGHFRLYTQREE